MSRGNAGRLDALDGLRAFAVAAVFLVHLRIPGCHLGSVGVNLFFVLSGYLITGILVRSPRGPGYFRTFYVRRTLRIFPIYYLMIVVALGYAWRTHTSAADWPWYALYLQNNLIGATVWHTKFPIWMGHTWTLAIEEQFYLLWPLAVRFLSLPSLRRFIFVLLAFCLACRALAQQSSLAPTMFNLPLQCQLDSLLMGALVAVWPTGMLPSRRAARLMTWIGGGVLLTLILGLGMESYRDAYAWSENPWNQLLFPALSLFFAGLLCLSLEPGSRLGRFLSARPLVHLGGISYGLYMFHEPIFFMVHRYTWRWHHWGTIPTSSRILAGIAGVLLTYLAARLSWWLIEAPLNRLKDRLAPSRTATSATRKTESVAVFQPG